MGAAVAITRLDLTAGELRKAARKEKNGTAARRILALALVLEGSDRKKAAESCGMDRQTLRDTSQDVAFVTHAGWSRWRLIANQRKAKTVADCFPVSDVPGGQLVGPSGQRAKAPGWAIGGVVSQLAFGRYLRPTGSSFLFRWSFCLVYFRYMEKLFIYFSLTK